MFVNVCELVTVFSVFGFSIRLVGFFIRLVRLVLFQFQWHYLTTPFYLFTRFTRDRGKLTRVIATIFRRKFDGPYYSWSVTPVDKQEGFFRTFAVMFLPFHSFQSQFLTI